MPDSSWSRGCCAKARAEISLARLPFCPAVMTFISAPRIQRSSYRFLWQFKCSGKKGCASWKTAAFEGASDFEEVQIPKKKGDKMRKVMLMLLVCSISSLAFSQSTPKYQAATVLNVVAVQSAHDEAPSVYHISVKLDDTVYVVRYVSEDGASVKYLAGTQLPILVGEDTIRFNDLLGHSHEVPIVKKRSATIASAK
jgi:hypothetical protein